MLKDLGMNGTVNDMNMFNCGFEFQSPTYADTCQVNMLNNLLQKYGCADFVLELRKAKSKGQVYWIT